MPIRRREKASDVFAKSTPFLGRPTDSFTAAFPSIEDCRLEITFSELGVEGDRAGIYTKTNLTGEFIDCRNPRCYNGGLPIGAILRGAEYAKETVIDTTEHCQGYEGSPKGRRNYGSCMTRFKVKGTITYKPDSGAGSNAGS